MNETGSRRRWLVIAVLGGGALAIGVFRNRMMAINEARFRARYG
ncbi:MAG: hypothetical protein N2037_03645 [Acidimicrobiales bacterium]|nr:hypothetical protein [Acidimicrobiales bacterium]